MAQFVCTSQQTQPMLSLLTSDHYENHHHAPEIRSASLCGRSGTEKPHLGKILPPPKPEHCVLPNVGQHPKNHTSSLALSHTRLAAFPWDFRLAIGRGCRDLHLREVCSTHICNGDQKRVLILKHVFLTRNTEKDSQSFQRKQSDSFVAHIRTHQRRTVGNASALPLLVSTHYQPCLLLALISRHHNASMSSLAPNLSSLEAENPLQKLHTEGSSHAPPNLQKVSTRFAQISKRTHPFLDPILLAVS